MKRIPGHSFDSNCLVLLVSECCYNSMWDTKEFFTLCCKILKESIKYNLLLLQLLLEHPCPADMKMKIIPVGHDFLDHDLILVFETRGRERIHFFVVSMLILLLSLFIKGLCHMWHQSELYLFPWRLCSLVIISNRKYNFLVWSQMIISFVSFSIPWS